MKQNLKEVFYSPANDELIVTRKSLFEFSFKMAQERLSRMRNMPERSDLEMEHNKYVNSLYTNSKEMTLNSSQFGDDRPLSCVRYSPDGTKVATGSLSSYIKIWNVSDLGCVDTLRGHEERITSVSWTPEAISQSSGKYVFLVRVFSRISVHKRYLIILIFNQQPF